MNSNRSATRSGLVRWYLAVLDLKTSLSASVWGTKKICPDSRVPESMRNCLHESHVNNSLVPELSFLQTHSWTRPGSAPIWGGKKGESRDWTTLTSVFSNMAEIESVPTLNAVCSKESASLRQADVPTNFNQIWLWQKICSSTTIRSASVRQSFIKPLDIHVTSVGITDILARGKSNFPN